MAASTYPSLLAMTRSALLRRTRPAGPAHQHGWATAFPAIHERRKRPRFGGSVAVVQARGSAGWGQPTTMLTPKDNLRTAVQTGRLPQSRRYAS